MDFLIGENNDWVVENGDVVLCRDASFIRQQWLIRMRKYRGEWVLDANDGVPYVQELYGKNTKAHLLEVVRSVTLNTPGVLAIEYVSVDEFDRQKRSIKVTVEAVIEGPENLLFQYSGTFMTPPADCPRNFPALIEGLNTWVDAQDLLNVAGGTSGVTITNKAAAGGGTGDTTITTVSPINLHRAMTFDGVSMDAEVEDTPAIRHGDGTLTLLTVFRNTEVADGTYGIVTLRGVTAAGEFEYLALGIRIESGVYYLRVSSQREGETIEVSEGTVASGVSPNIVAVVLSDSGSLYVEVNGTVITMDVPSLTQRALDGSYFIGAGTSDAGVKQDYFNGYIGELLVYEGVLSTEDLSSVTVCLARKWGLELSESTTEYLGYGYFPYGYSAYGL